MMQACVGKIGDAPGALPRKGLAAMCSPIVATGDEDGTVQVEYEITEGSPIFSVRTRGQTLILHRSSSTGASTCIHWRTTFLLILVHRKSSLATDETGAADLPRVGTSVPPDLSALLHQSIHSVRIVARTLLPQYRQRRRSSSFHTPVCGPWAYARYRTGSDADRPHGLTDRVPNRPAQTIDFSPRRSGRLRRIGASTATHCRDG
jgi:hypothetical protein